MFFKQPLFCIVRATFKLFWKGDGRFIFLWVPRKKSKIMTMSTKYLQHKYGVDFVMKGLKMFSQLRVSQSLENFLRISSKPSGYRWVACRPTTVGVKTSAYSPTFYPSKRSSARKIGPHSTQRDILVHFQGNTLKQNPRKIYLSDSLLMDFSLFLRPAAQSSLLSGSNLPEALN